MAMAGNGNNPRNTPARELQFGDDTLAFGDDLIAFGAEIPSAGEVIRRLTPEQVVVMACRSESVNAFPVFQAGEVILPSVIFQSASATPVDALQRSIASQTLALTVRHEEYGKLVMTTERIYNALRKFPERRVRSILGFTDGFADDFSFYFRTLTVEIQR